MYIFAYLLNQTLKFELVFNSVQILVLYIYFSKMFSDKMVDSQKCVIFFHILKTFYSGFKIIENFCLNVITNLCITSF